MNLRSRAWQRLSWKKVVIVLAALPVLYVANRFFLAMRVTSHEIGKQNHVGTVYLGERALDFLSKGGNSQFDQQVANNLRDRTFVLRYFSDLLAASWTHTPLYGGLVVYDFEIAIPSFLSPNKDKLRMIEGEEYLANPQYGLPMSDEANSILTTGVSDFGLFGVIAYPILVVVLMGIFVRWLTRSMPEVVKLVVVFAVVGSIWQVEVGTAVFFILIRNFLFLSLPLVIIAKWGEHNPRKGRPRSRRVARTRNVTLAVPIAGSPSGPRVHY